MLVVYTNKCIPCKHKSEIRAVNSIARSLKTCVIIKEVRSNKVLIKEATSVSDVAIPFVHNTDTKSSISLYHIRDWL
jgi:hypothetical protein